MSWAGSGTGCCRWSPQAFLTVAVPGAGLSSAQADSRGAAGAERYLNSVRHDPVRLRSFLPATETSTVPRFIAVLMSWSMAGFQPEQGESAQRCSPAVRKRPCNGGRKPSPPPSNAATAESGAAPGKGVRMSSWRRCLPVLLLLIASTGWAPPAQAVDASHHVVPIARARSLPLDAVVTVDGVATTPSGAFESSFFDRGFGLQDRGAGIYVSVAVDLGITPGTRVRVTGTLRDSSGLLVLVPADPAAVVPHGRGPEVRPRRIATGAVDESSEGRLVRVVARITRAPASDLPYGFTFFVDDGSGELTIFVNTQTAIDLTGLAAGRTVGVTGFSSQFGTHYEIDPRFQADVTRRHT
jgi:hypothetical protein